MMTYSQPTLCDVFRYQALLTWNRLSVDQWTGIHLGEESITDFNLLELQGQRPYDIITDKYSKKKEAKMVQIGNGGFFRKVIG
jgi:hypothetical protein